MKSNVLKIVKWIFISPAILVLLAVAFCEINKAYWDNKVDTLCAKDGGVTIYERVSASRSAYPMIKLTSTNQPIIPFDRYANDEDPFYMTAKTTFLESKWISLARYEQTIIRREDKKTLSRIISYGRSGGDFPTGFHPSHYLCRKVNDDIAKFSTTVVIKE